MGQFTRKLILMAIAVCFLLSVVACGGSGTSTTAQTTAAPATAAPATTAKADEPAAEDDAQADTAAETTKAAESAATTAAAKEDLADAVFQDGPLAPYPETITINWIVATDPNRYFHEGETYENNAWNRKLLDDLNIKLEVAYSVDNNSYDERLRTLLVSGDLPDIFHSYDRNVFIEAHRAGYLTEIGSLLDQYATPAVKEYQDKFTDSFNGAKINGEIYGFPDGNDNFHTGNYIWIRDDWLANTNSQPPVTVDDFIELARTFTFGDPNGDGSKTYGFAMTSNVGENLIALTGAFGVPAAWGGIYYYRDGKITYSYIQPEVKNALEVLRNMYSEGLIDPEFIVKDMSVLETDVSRHVLGMFDYRNWGGWYPYNFTYESDGIITRPYPIPSVPGIEYKVGVSNNFGGRLTMLNSQYAHPEAFVKIINLFNLTCYESLSMDDFETYYSNSYHGLAPVHTWIPNELYAPQVHEAMQKGTGDALPAAIKPYYDFVVNFENGTDDSRPAYGTWAQTSERGSMAIALYDYRDGGHMVENIYGLDGKIPESALENSEVLGTLMNTAFTEIIIGDKPLDSFDDFVQNWLANGGQNILNEMEGFYSAP